VRESDHDIDMDDDGDTFKLKTTVWALSLLRYVSLTRAQGMSLQFLIVQSMKS
jgi:hypothetical protein